jgi:hypothetical protein
VLEDNNSENAQDSNTPLIIRTIRHDDATCAFNTCYNWAEENNVQTEDIVTLERLQQNVLEEALRKKNKNIDVFFFLKQLYKCLE